MHVLEGRKVKRVRMGGGGLVLCSFFSLVSIIAMEQVSECPQGVH